MWLRSLSQAAFLLALVLMLPMGFTTSGHNLCPKTKSGMSSPVIKRATYNQVLDILFPRDTLEDNNAIFVFILRFEPSSHSESQIVIKRYPDAVELIEYKSLDGNVYIKLNRTLAQTGEEDAVKMARLIHVEKRTVSVPYIQIKRWSVDLLDSISLSTRQLREKGENYNKEGTITVALDGTTYELWHTQGLHRLYFMLYDAEIGMRSTGEFKLAQSMNTVRIAVEKTIK